MTNFIYRYVKYGTCFIQGNQNRSATNQFPENMLCDNEIAVDVGGTCWGLSSASERILDHHFHRDDGGQFPAAAVAVLHNAARIFSSLDPFVQKGLPVFLISHETPDFDAFCAMYLARRIIEGDIPADGWEDFGLLPEGWWQGRMNEKITAEHGRRFSEIDWYEPLPRWMLDAYAREPKRRASVLLASYAAFVDNCRRLSCPKNRGLHSILYSGITRGRSFDHDGALDFFREVQAAIEGGLNPLHDSVMEKSDNYAAELALLDREVEAYQRDIKRARRVIVNLARATSPFQEWYDKCCSNTLLALEESSGSDITHRKVQNIHLNAWGDARDKADGIYIRDPESVLFKEWARNDADNASEGKGFLFTAVAYSTGRPGAVGENTSQYIFSIDPERADRRHLYNVWAQLQAEEVKRISNKTISLKTCRTGYEKRAGSEFAEYFDDPWFDGVNYECTIVDTPNRGTLIGPAGNASDLCDDPVAVIVRRELEMTFYSAPLEIFDLTASLSAGDKPKSAFPVDRIPEDISALESGYFRFCRVALHPETNLLNDSLANQIGRLLWSSLDPEGNDGQPIDFETNHRLYNANWVGVWSRQGVAIAYRNKEAVLGEIDRFQRYMEKIAALARELDVLIEAPCENRLGNNSMLLEESEKLLHELARIKHDLAMPGGGLLRRFFEAASLDQVLGMLRDLNAAAAERAQRKYAEEEAARDKRAEKQSKKLKDSFQHILLLLGFPALMFAYFDAVDIDLKQQWDRILLFGLGALAVGEIFYQIIRLVRKRKDEFAAKIQRHTTP